LKRKVFKIFKFNVLINYHLEEKKYEDPIGIATYSVNQQFFPMLPYLRISGFNRN